MVTTVNDTNNVLKTLFSNIVDDQEKIADIHDVSEDINKINAERVKSISDNIERMEHNNYPAKPNLKCPEINNPNLQNLIDELEKSDKNSKGTPISATNFNFLSNEMMSLISLMIKYLQNMIKKYEASRELGNLFMQIGLDVADSVKKDLYAKAGVMLSAAISGAVVSMAINGLGAFTSMKGLGKEMVPGTHSNSTMIKGGLVSSLADPTSKIIDQSIQTEGLRLEGDIKVLEARSQALNQVANNNNDIQREAMDIIKALVQAIEAIVRANQDTASSIAGSVRG